MFSCIKRLRDGINFPHSICDKRHNKGVQGEVTRLTLELGFDLDPVGRISSGDLTLGLFIAPMASSTTATSSC